MNHRNLIRGICAVAIAGVTIPAFAQTSMGSGTAGAPIASPNAVVVPAPIEAKPLCSSLNHPNAGKHADKDTGMAKDRSSSPVHMDCIADSATSSLSGNATIHSGTGMTAPGAATTPAPVQPASTPQERIKR